MKKGTKVLFLLSQIFFFSCNFSNNTNDNSNKNNLGFNENIDYTAIPFLKSNKKYILINTSNSIALNNSEFDNIVTFDNGSFFITEKNKKYGILNKEGKELSPNIFENDFISFSEGLASVKQNGQWGFIDSTGNLIIKPTFENGANFNEGLAPVKRNGKWGFINNIGDNIIPFKFDFASGFNDGISLVRLNDKYGFINKNGNFTINPIYDYAQEFEHGISEVTKNQKTFYINTKEEVFYTNFKNIGKLNDGLRTFSYDNKFGLLNNDGEVKVNADYEYMSTMTEGMSIVKKGNKFGFINNKGELVVNYIYDDAQNFKNGLAYVVSNDKWGFIDITGKVVISISYPIIKYRNAFDSELTGVTEYSNDRILFQKDSKYGYIDKSSKLIIEPKYYSGQIFSHGFAMVSDKNGNYFYIDKSGKEFREIPK